MEENFDFEAFDSAVDTDAGIQPDGVDDTPDPEEIADADDSAEGNTDEDPAEPDADNAAGAADDAADEAGSNEGGDENDPAAEETFTLKVNKETRTVTRQEMISLAQKGADYDRVKGALEKATTQLQTFQTEGAAAADAYAILEELAQESKTSVAEYLNELRINNLVNAGVPRGEAKERIARLQLEKENAALRGAQPAQAEVQTEAQKMRERADREIAEFREAYPDVQITQELVNSLMADVHGGMTLLRAYQKQENDKLAAENRRLEQELAAERKNKANRGSSPGSMSDSGSRKRKDMFDEFFEALG